MFLLYEYDIFWAFLIISSVIPIFAFLIFRVLAPISKGPEKLSSYEWGIEPMEDAWLQFLLGAVLIREIIIKDYSINHHLLQRSPLKHFSNTKVQYLPTN